MSARFHARGVHADRATLIAVGDCDHDADVERFAAAAFAGWAGEPASRVAVPTRRCRRRARLNVVPRPGAPQSELRIGHVAAARATRPTTTRSSR